MAKGVRRLAKVVAAVVQSSPPSSSPLLSSPAAQVELKVTNNWSIISSSNPSIIENIRDSLTVSRKTFKLPQASSPYYGPSKASFISPKGQFGTGLLPIVINKLETEKAGYTINDKRTPFPALFNAGTTTCKQIDPSGSLFASVGVTLHDYQVSAVNAALMKHRGIIKCATGGGKSWILAGILKALGDGVPAVVIVNQRTLAQQLYDTLKKAGIANVGMIIGGVNEPNTITICTIQSLHKNELKKSELAKAKVLLVDEVHEYATKISRNTFNKFPDAHMRLGFSATPFKNTEHKHLIMSMFGPAIVDVSIDELVDKKVITNSIVKFYSIGYPKITTESWKVAESEGIVKNPYFNDSVVKLVNSIPSGRIMILVQRISHGDTLHKLLPGSFWISGKDDSETRAEVIDKLRNSKGTKVVALVSRIGFVGVDVFVHHLINAAGGRSPFLTIQKIGRGLRKASDKEVLYYHDFLFSLTMNRMLCWQSLARMKTLKQNGYEVERAPALVQWPM